MCHDTDNHSISYFARFVNIFSHFPLLVHDLLFDVTRSKNQNHKDVQQWTMIWDEIDEVGNGKRFLFYSLFIIFLFRHICIFADDGESMGSNEDARKTKTCFLF